MSFEHPWGGLGLLLFLPFVLWLRRQKPSLRFVGGLQPFRELPVIGDGRRQRRPLAFWLFLAAYLCATLALAGPRSASLPPLSLVDRSESVDGVFTHAFPVEEIRTLGEDGEVITAYEIMDALQEVQPGRPVSVHTDQLPPQGLPAHISWATPLPSSLAGHRGMILQAVPVEADAWRIHWALTPGQEAVLQVGSWTSPALQGLAGSTQIPVPPLPSAIFLKPPDQVGTAAETLASHVLVPVTFLLSPDVHSDWEDALLAIWPAASFQRVTAVTEGAFLSVRRDKELTPNPDSWSDLDLESSPTPEGITRLAVGWRAWREVHDPAFDRREWILPFAQPQTQWTAAAAGFAASQRTPSWLLWLILLGGCCAATAWFTLPRRSTAQA